MSDKNEDQEESWLHEQLEDLMVTQAQSKLDCFKTLKSDINTAVMEANEKIKEARELIKANLLDKNNPDGLLKPERNYLDCLQLNQRNLN